MGIQTGCFGYQMGQCTVLTELVCENRACSFYKSRADYLAGRRQAVSRAERLTAAEQSGDATQQGRQAGGAEF